MDDDEAVKGIRALIERAMAERLTRSYCLASKEERQGRLRAITALSAELERIKAESIFCTGLGESVVEDIIEGDWRSALGIGLHLTFESEGPEARARHAPLWAKFVEILREEGALAEKRVRSPSERPD